MRIFSSAEWCSWVLPLFFIKVVVYTPLCSSSLCSSNSIYFYHQHYDPIANVLAFLLNCMSLAVLYDYLLPKRGQPYPQQPCSGDWQRPTDLAHSYSRHPALQLPGWGIRILQRFFIAWSWNEEWSWLPRFKHDTYPNYVIELKRCN